MTDPLTRSEQLCSYLCRADDGTFVYAEIDQDNPHEYSTKLYIGGNGALSKVRVLDIRKSPTGHAFYVNLLSGAFVCLVKDATYGPPDSDATWYAKLLYLFALRSFMETHLPRRRQLLHRLRVTDYDIIEAPDGKVTVVKR